MFGNDDYVFGQYVRYRVDKEKKSSEWEGNSARALWVGREDDGSFHYVVPIVWDPNANLYNLGATIKVSRVAHIGDPNKLEFPLIVGPGEGKPIEDFEDFMSKLLEPRYTAAKGSVEEQVDGEDPILEVEEIVGKRGSKKKSMKYQVKWKGSKVLTWEPLTHSVRTNRKSH